MAIFRSGKIGFIGLLHEISVDFLAPVSDWKTDFIGPVLRLITQVFISAL
jgi:hypothetical protein